jgi:hypothetical protein
MNETVFAAGISALCTALIGGVIHLANTFHKNGQEKRAAQFNEQSRIIDRQEKQILRMDAQITELQKVIFTLQEEHTKCREETAELREYQRVLYEYYKSTQKALLKDNIKIEEPPAPPKPREQKVDVGFMVRDITQSTQIVQALDHTNHKSDAA